MKFYDDHYTFACLIDIIAFDKTIEGKSIGYTSKKETDGVLICRIENIHIANVQRFLKVIPKAVFDSGRQIAVSGGS